MMYPMSPASDLSSGTVLVVDDNEHMLEILERLLTQHGMTVLCTRNGRECLEIVGRRSVDVVILDVMLPDKSGLEICRELKRSSPSLPVILLTGKDDMATRAAGMAAQASEFIAKPFNIRDLLARVRTQITTRQWESEMIQRPVQSPTQRRSKPTSPQK